MKQTEYRIVENLPLARDVFRMRLAGDSSAFTAPGQFLNLRVQGCYLRRPISVCDWDREGVTIIYKVVGKGTATMSRIGPGEALDALTGLGNGFSPEKGGASPPLLGGGGGVPPLYRLCRELIARGASPTAVLGFGSAADVFYREEFEALGAQVRIATADGSAGQRGFVTDAMAGLDYTYFYACGPEAMFRAVDRIAKSSGQYSFEERMGCGFGACMGCSCRTLTGSKRICREGPVLEREEILWEK